MRYACTDLIIMLWQTCACGLGENQGDIKRHISKQSTYLSSSFSLHFLYVTHVCRSMDRLAVLNVVGVAAIGLLALTALGLGAHGVARGSAYPIPPWPQWTQLGRTAAEQWQAMAQVMPVVIACYVAHQVRPWYVPHVLCVEHQGVRCVSLDSRCRTMHSLDAGHASDYCLLQCMSGVAGVQQVLLRHR